MTSDQRPLTPLQAEVAGRLGVLPNFFCTAAAAPGLIDELWTFARSAYLDSPLPSLFKERLFVHLSRFCEIRYCIVRHVGFLVGHGRPAGDAAAEPESVDDVIALLRRPVPEASILAAALDRLRARTGTLPLPSPGTPCEADLFDALTAIFIEPARSERARAAVRSAVGDAVFEMLTAYLAFVRTAHFWTETHPELAFEADMLALMELRSDLRECLLSPADAERVRAGGDMRRILAELHQTEEALAATERRQRALIEGMPQLVWRAVGGGEWTWASPQWTAFTGQAEADSHGWGWLATLHPDDRAMARQAWAEALPRGALDVEYRICHPAEGAYRWFHTRATPVRDDGGRLVEWLGTSTDIHDLRTMQEQQQVLVAELQHRTRNLMAVIRSMSDKTARASDDLEDFRARFRDRLEALARVQGLLSRLNEHDRVTFDELINAEMQALDGNAERVYLAGPKGVRLRSSMVQTLAMALHELATNAVKYGALGQPSGRLAVTWTLQASGPGERPWLHIDWRETGVVMPPAGAKPRDGGQGRELIERALPYQLGAETAYELGPEGVHCRIAIPVSRTAAAAAAREIERA